MDNDEKPMTLRSAFWAAEFWLLFAGMVSTYGVSAVIVIPLVVIGLSIALLPNFSLWSQAREVGDEGMWLVMVALSLANSLLTACGVVMFAEITRWFWGASCC